MSKNFMKKTLAGIFALVIVASSTPIAPFVTVMDSNSITASAVEVTADGLEYEVNGDAITITGYRGTSSDVVIPSKIEDVPVTAIGNDAFSGNRTIIDVTIPDSVTSIGEYAFSQSYLENVNIPNTVTSIGAHAFSGTYITDLVIPDSLESISEYTFNNCKWLTNVTLPVSIKSIGDTAFESCPKLTNVKYAGSLADWCSISIDRGNGPLTNAKITLSQGEQIICGSTLIWTLDENGVLTISGDDEVFPEFWVNNKAVEWCDKKENVKKVVFETPNLTTLGSGAFFKFVNLESIDLPDSLTTINQVAFYNCSALKNITLPDSLTVISMGIFYDCTSLTAINIPDTVTSIGDNAFSHCPLSEITIPDTVTSIGNDAFSDTNLTKITIPNSVESFGYCVFQKCSSLSEVTLPDSLTIIPSSTFANCTSLESVTIPDSVAEIYYGAFSGCSSLSDITIPDSVTLIEDLAFYSCENLTSITIPDSVTSIGKLAFYGSGLTEITIPDSVKSIGVRVFDDCTSLTSITAPCALKDSMENAMGNCTAEITYTHKYSKNGYVITCTAGGETFDYTDVFAALDDYDDSNESNYTADSWEDYSDAAAAIKTLTDNFGKDVFVSEQAELTDAVSAYNTAKDALVLKDADYTELESAISDANDYTADNYTEDSWAALETALAEAYAVDLDLKADQQGTIDAAKNNLLDAINGLVLKDADYSAVDAAIDTVAATDRDAYTAASLNALDAAVAAVERDLDITRQDEVDAMAQAIADAIAALKEVADTSRLEAAIADADAANKADYSASVWSAIQDKVAEGNTYIGAGYASDDVQGDVDMITDELNDLLLKKLNDADYTAVEAAIANIPDDLSIYTDASVDALIAAYNNVVRDLKEDKQGDVDAMATAIEDAIAALEEKPKYDTLYEEYLVTAPTVTENGTYNKRAYHYENDTKVIDTEKVFTVDKNVTFEQWYLRTLIQYQTDGTKFDLRFVSMLDENLDQYQKAGFTFTINGTAVSDELSTVTANTSYIVDSEEVNISAFSEDNDYFFLQNYVFDIGDIDLDDSLAVTAYVVLADGTELKGTKAVTFTLSQFEC